MTQSQVPSAWRRATSAVTVPSGRRVKGQVAADQGRALLADGEFPARRHRAGKVRPDGVRAAQHRAVAAIDDGLRLIKGHHALDVSRPLAGDQQPLQVLRITRGVVE